LKIGQYLVQLLKFNVTAQQVVIMPCCYYQLSALLFARPLVWNLLPYELKDMLCGFSSFRLFCKAVLFILS